MDVNAAGAYLRQLHSGRPPAVRAMYGSGLPPPLGAFHALTRFPTAWGGQESALTIRGPRGIMGSMEKNSHTARGTAGSLAHASGFDVPRLGPASQWLSDSRLSLRESSATFAERKATLVDSPALTPRVSMSLAYASGFHVPRSHLGFRCPSLTPRVSMVLAREHLARIGTPASCREGQVAARGGRRVTRGGVGQQESRELENGEVGHQRAHRALRLRRATV